MWPLSADERLALSHITPWMLRKYLPSQHKHVICPCYTAAFDKEAGGTLLARTFPRKASSMAPVALHEADSVEILTLVDNTIDMMLAGTPKAKRFPLRPDAVTQDVLIAEHGFATMVTVRNRGTTDSLLFDAGLSKDGLVHNMDVMEIQPQDFRAIVLSHGHADHAQGLMGLIDRTACPRASQRIWEHTLIPWLGSSNPACHLYAFTRLPLTHSTTRCA